MSSKESHAIDNERIAYAQWGFRRYGPFSESLAGLAVDHCGVGSSPSCPSFLQHFLLFLCILVSCISQPAPAYRSSLSMSNKKRRFVGYVCDDETSDEQARRQLWEHGQEFIASNETPPKKQRRASRTDAVSRSIVTPPLSRKFKPAAASDDNDASWTTIISPPKPAQTLSAAVAPLYGKNHGKLNSATRWKRVNTTMTRCGQTLTEGSLLHQAPC